MRVVLATLAFLVSASLPVSSDFAETPMGWSGFCDRAPSVCAERGPVVTVPMTRLARVQLEETNFAVNKGVTYRSDRALYGREEHWTLPTAGEGDCEDYALEKQRRLVARGWPRSALLMTIVVDPGGRLHAVLIAKTTAGDLVLDNQTFAILPPRLTGHEFVSRQSRSNPNRWVRFGDPS